MKLRWLDDYTKCDLDTRQNINVLSIMVDEQVVSSSLLGLYKVGFEKTKFTSVRY